MLTGALISFPLFELLNFIARLRNLDVEDAFPPWLYDASYVLYYVFPLTIAYAIVVQRAMDVRLILRESLQYTLAWRGVIVLQIVLSAILFSAPATLVASYALNYGITVLLMGIGIWAIFLLNDAMHRVARLIDRRFFREAYPAGQIGFKALGQKRSEELYSGSDLRLLSSIATQTSLGA